MNKIATEMEREYEKAIKAEMQGDMEARKRHLNNAYKLRDVFLEDFLGSGGNGDADRGQEE